MDKKILYRWIAGGLLWMMLISVVIISVRSVNIVNKTGRVAESALTLQSEQALSSMRDTARAFAVEWATWNGNTDDYANRLGVFLLRVPPAYPDGIQEVTSSAVTSIQKIKSRDYRVRVLMHTRRLVPIEHKGCVPEVMIPVTMEDLKSRDGKEKQNLQAWQDSLMNVELRVKLDNENIPQIAGLPVIIPTGGIGNSDIRLECTTTATADFKAFANQFLGLYYTGQALTNFTLPNSKIKPLNAGWKLVSVNDVLVDNERNPTKACVQATVSAPGIGNLAQIVYLKVRRTEGSYLVEDLGAGL